MSKQAYIATWAALFILASGAYLQHTSREDIGVDDTPESSSETPSDVSVAPSTAGVEVYDGITVPINSTELKLSGRGLSGSLKAEVRQLSNLRVLDVSGNNFTGLPAEVGQLSKLEVLNLSNNPFTGLPHELGNLQNLQRLDVRGTQYSEFDMEIIESALPETTEILK